jgi:hypothetical protein
MEAFFAMVAFYESSSGRDRIGTKTTEHLWHRGEDTKKRKSEMKIGRGLGKGRFVKSLSKMISKNKKLKSRSVRKRSGSS